jgi:hypothetical protein
MRMVPVAKIQDKGCGKFRWFKTESDTMEVYVINSWLKLCSQDAITTGSDMPWAEFSFKS